VSRRDGVAVLVTQPSVAELGGDMALLGKYAAGVRGKSFEIADSTKGRRKEIEKIAKS
jgi:hypothetical protein